MGEARRAGWTRFFRGATAPEEGDLLGKFVDGIARIFEGASEEETLRQIRVQLCHVFGCEDIALFGYDPEERPADGEGDWVLVGRSGLGRDHRVCQTHARSFPELVVGRPVAYSEEVAEAAVFKAVALAFEKDAFYGVDIERQVVLLEEPTAEDDLGSGDLSLLALPLRYHHRVGRAVEQARVGVLALFRTPTTFRMGDLQRGLRSLLAYALVTSSATIRDPVTELYNAAHLRDELERFMSLHGITGGKLPGGLVVGAIDALPLYQETLRAEAKVLPEEVCRELSETLRGVAGCVLRRASDHTVAPDRETYRAGVAARLGRTGFGVLLPLLKPRDLIHWSRELSREVVDRHFTSEHLLGSRGGSAPPRSPPPEGREGPALSAGAGEGGPPRPGSRAGRAGLRHELAGEITVSLRIIPLGGRGARTAEEAMRTAEEALDELAREQSAVMGDAEALAATLKTTRILTDGRWVPPLDYLKEMGAT